MTTATMTLAEFLQARFTHDRNVARAAIGTAAFYSQTGQWSFEHVRDRFGLIPVVFAYGDGGGKTQVANLEGAWDREQRGEHIARWDPARVLRECDAKQHILDAYVEAAHQYDEEHDLDGSPKYRDGHMWTYLDKLEVWEQALKILALPYADHPAYRPEWRL